MKTKWFFVYVGVGIAFAAVSLWVMLSGGRNARAIRTKYKLGGILLVAWAMLSASTCSGPGPFVTCYEPAVTCYDVAMLVNETILSIKDKTGTELQEGDVLLIRIVNPEADRFIVRMKPAESDETILKEAVFTVPKELTDNAAEWEWPVKDVTYKGEISVIVYCPDKDGDGNDIEVQVGAQHFTLQ